MNIFLQASAAVLLGAILIIIVGKRNAEIGIVLTIAVCCFVILGAVSYWRRIWDFLTLLRDYRVWDNELLSTLWKVVGIGLISEICALICTDAGSAALGKSLQFVADAVILYLSIPIFEELMRLLQNILGAI